MAYECSPYRGSEWAVGWGRLLGAAKVAETHVVTSEENFSALERAKREGILPPNVFFYTPAADARLRKLQGKPGLFAYNYRAYDYWQQLAFKFVRSLHQRERFDLIHQISVCTFREPGYAWQLDVPFIWGPGGGTQNYPTRFLPMLAPLEALKEGLRSLGNLVALRNGRVRAAAESAAMVIAANELNQRDLRRSFRRDVELLLETGLHEIPEPDRTRFEARLAAARTAKKTGPLRILWSGELHTRKALPILLRALASVSAETEWQLDVVGDGPQRGRWMRETERLGIAHRVHFLGRLPFTEAVKCMNSAELFCFTSLRDTSGNVVLEALAAGVPVLCFNHQGAGDMISEFSGVKLPVRSPREAYRDWAKAVETLAADPRKLFALSRGASLQAQKFLWSRNHDTINATYQHFVDQRRQGAVTAAPSYVSPEVFDVPLGVAHGSSR